MTGDGNGHAQGEASVGHLTAQHHPLAANEADGLLVGQADGRLQKESRKVSH